MFKTKLCVALIGAAALAPLAAGSFASSNAPGFVATPLGLAIARQGNQALRSIRREAWACLRRQKPAPLEAMIRDVKRDATRAEVVQEI